MRGYEPAEVDRRLAELTAARDAAEQQAARLATRVEELSASDVPARQAADASSRGPTFTSLGARIGQILSLADDEADELRAAAAAEVNRRLLELDATSARTMAEADRYAEQARLAADRDAARILDEARRGADQIVDEANRHATARRAEAEAIYEGQRAQAAQAANDFEQALTQRRNKAEHDLTHRTAIAERQLSITREHAQLLRAETEQAAAEAAREVAALIADAEQRAEQLVAEAVARADRIRSDSERELRAATQRRDSINVQLANVRQMLARLTGNGADLAAAAAEPPRAQAEAAATLSSVDGPG